MAGYLHVTECCEPDEAVGMAVDAVRRLDAVHVQVLAARPDVDHDKIWHVVVPNRRWQLSTADAVANVLAEPTTGAGRGPAARMR